MGTWIAGIIVFSLIGFAAYRVYEDRKNGKGCGNGCESCLNRQCCSGTTIPNRCKEDSE